MQLSKNFTLEELCHSNTANSKGIKNIPSEKEMANLLYLAEKVLQPLRDGLGKSINVNVGFRNKVLNKAVGGSSTSFHLTGCAADLDNGEGNSEIFHFIKDNLPYTELIWEKGSDKNPSWVHVAIAKGREKEKETLKTKDGKSYKPYK